MRIGQQSARIRLVRSLALRLALARARALARESAVTVLEERDEQGSSLRLQQHAKAG